MYMYTILERLCVEAIMLLQVINSLKDCMGRMGITLSVMILVC